MKTTTLSSKGRVIVPKSVRDARHWKLGTEFAVELVPEGVLLRPLKPFKPSRFEEVFGCLKFRGKPRTMAEMGLAVARTLAERHARGRY